MDKQYFSINIRAFLDNELPDMENGEEVLNGLLSDFSCGELNQDIDNFLHNSAIESAKKRQTATYIVLDENVTVVGYYTITIKPISVSIEGLSSNEKRKFKRVSATDKNEQYFSTSAYLLAQFGKNYILPKEERISGRDLMAFVFDTMKEASRSYGGLVQFLECEDVPKLLQFYTGQGFKKFSERMTDGKNSHLLHQLFRFID